jgi:hypothetical protein
MGTRRSFLPFPKIRSRPTSGSMFSVFSWITSEARRPLAYMVSRMALSRSPSAVERSGASSRASTWARFRKRGRGLKGRGDRMFSIGSSVTFSSRTRKR